MSSVHVADPLSTSSQELIMRDPEEFSESLKMTLDLITLNEVPRVVGSAAFLAHRYPSDVDVFEQVTVKFPQEKALDFYVDQFQNIAQRLLVNSKYMKFNDFKAGMDSRFDINVPEESTQSQREKAIVGLTAKVKLPNKIFKKLYSAAGDINIYRQELYDLKILRWIPEEIIAGYKYLVDGKIITLKEALSMNAIVKMDVIAWISGRFQSVEAFYNLQYTNPVTGDIIDFYPLGNYVTGLLEDVEKYSSQENYSPLKIAKRLWSLSRVIKCHDLLNVLTPLLQSDMAALNQINSDAEVLQNLLVGPMPVENLSDEQIGQIFSEILTFHKRAANHLSGEIYSDFGQLIDLAFPLWLFWVNEKNLNVYLLNVLLDKIQKLLKPIINSRSQEFLKNVEKLNITCRNPQFRIVQGLPVSSLYGQA